MPTGIYKRTEEHKRKISEGNKGKKRSEEFKRKLRIVNKGKKYPNRKSPPPLSKEHKEKIRNKLKGKHSSPSTEFKKGDKRPSLSEETKRKIGLANSIALRGKKLSKETKLKMSKAHKGENNWNWQGGITPIDRRIRASIEYIFWREGNLARDNYTCQKCKVRGGKLCVHHIQNFHQFPELRFAINNGITFCKHCHDKFHKIYGKKNNTQEQLKEFLCQTI